MANHLEHMESSCKDPSTVDLVYHFGPCSPVQCSLTPLFSSLVDNYTPTWDSMPHNEQYVATTADDMGQRTTNVYELSTINEIVQEPPTHSKQMVLQVATYVEDVVMVEEASENEEAGSVMDLTFGDPVDLVIASDGSTQCGVEAKRPPMEAAFPIDVTATKIKELQVVTSIENVVIVEDASNDEEDPTAIAVKNTYHRERNASASLMTYQCSAENARLAQHNKLRNLGIIGNDGKFDEDALQAYADYLKEVLPPDLLSSLKRVKGCAFWDLVARISLPLG
uniref:Uncharacterized protein n=1 Tax=Setaria viridis TaxID=4556 RepID=A0A4U6WB28_SETVI|nr:hypothetical protein SEVIR_1G204300v2 [Setaria viridis]